MKSKEDIKKWYANLINFTLCEIDASLDDKKILIDTINKALEYDLERLARSSGGKKAAENMTARQRKERAKNAIRARYNKIELI